MGHGALGREAWRVRVAYPDIDIVVTSSCRKLIHRTLKSFFDCFSYSGTFNLMVNIDVVPGNEKHLPGLLIFLEDMNAHVRINRRPTGLADAVNRVWGRIRAPYFFHLEDDWVFLRQVDLDPLIGIFATHGEVDHIRFSKERIPKNCWLYHKSEARTLESFRANRQCLIDGTKLVKTFTWSFNPSLNRSAVVKSFPKIPQPSKEGEAFICRYYEKVYGNRGVYLYGCIGAGHISRDIGRPLHRRLIRRLRLLKAAAAGGHH